MSECRLRLSWPPAAAVHTARKTGRARGVSYARSPIAPSARIVLPPERRETPLEPFPIAEEFDFPQPRTRLRRVLTPAAKYYSRASPIRCGVQSPEKLFHRDPEKSVRWYFLQPLE